MAEQTIIYIIGVKIKDSRRVPKETREIAII